MPAFTAIQNDAEIGLYAAREIDVKATLQTGIDQSSAPEARQKIARGKCGKARQKIARGKRGKARQKVARASGFERSPWISSSD